MATRERGMSTQQRIRLVDVKVAPRRREVFNLVCAAAGLRVMEDAAGHVMVEATGDDVGDDLVPVPWPELVSLPGDEVRQLAAAGVSIVDWDGHEWSAAELVDRALLPPERLLAVETAPAARWLPLLAPGCVPVAERLVLVDVQPVAQSVVVED